MYIIDEVHTPDSSRYWYAEKYEENQKNGRPQEHLSKEFVREWLMSKGFQGLEGQQMPVMDDDEGVFIAVTAGDSEDGRFGSSA